MPASGGATSGVPPTLGASCCRQPTTWWGNCAQSIPGRRSCSSPTATATFRSRRVSTTPLFADALAVQAACDGRPQCHFVDLRLAFSRDWAANHQRFEAADGGHWNAYANLLVAQTLSDYIENNHLLDRPKNIDGLAEVSAHR